MGNYITRAIKYVTGALTKTTTTVTKRVERNECRQELWNEIC